MPLLLFHVLLAVSLAAPGGEGHTVGGQTTTYYDDNPISMCQKPLPCGGHVDVHYPFFLANAASAMDGHHPGRAERRRLPEGDPRRHRPSVPPDTLFSLSANDVYLSFFFDCVFTADNPAPPDIPSINCSSFPGGHGKSFVALQSDMKEQDECPRACKMAVVVPVLKDWVLSPDYHPHIISAVSGAILLSLLLCMCILYSKRTPTIESFLQRREAPYTKRYTYSEVRTLTESFAHKIGKGGFGTVYRGSLPNGRLVAVKLLNNSKDDGQEFMNEVASIMRTSHVNAVTLMGYCLQGPKRALIYEYMPNGSLDRFAFGQSCGGENSLSWEKLFDIAVGIARGLEYLHHWCGTHIVHFNIKPHNILQDQYFRPKISDFGLAKLCMTKESIISIDGARGTIGYITSAVFSPQFGQISSKSDVYSYGMMILEMVGTRENINKSSEGSSKYFPEWVYEHLEEYCLNSGEISADNEIVRKLIIIGLWCIQLQPNNRPSMTRVVQMLESRADDLQIPPQTLLC
ncbi:LEAF RUST 10 DISEASE-RESISTANCE LOCUS RECEPTOR-LIKE PROTEIN KINASE-like 2.5 [Dichanthelium oligosanthes]|uniref:LEAF RUST 10 DISEASE-RESISTANCE LOCUS RECEPTOR-LIKE PROTEIN KINASE-like 2.5 n=1 Tax=Dichanthelium oligosanthes TaxID=888268 RepID=A0A1E5V5J6_9POAL|nr:LEAF RUST 10 DISEASE-RESISTANCE LOCUS RECEPTOR-LIKE PROTEIN KINASE-like 2.5 [Dichanthelium oligosanthes]